MTVRRTCVFFLVLLHPALARAQNAVPPVGEPPPLEQRGPEKAAIEAQVRDEYIREHATELQKRAEDEVEMERRAAWEQRGRDLIPRAVDDRLPAVEVFLSPRLAASGGGVGFGGSGGLALRFKSGLGLQAEGGVLSFRDPNGTAVPLLAAIAEPSIMYWVYGARKRDFGPDHVAFHLGTQMLFPLGESTPPSVYVTPMIGIDGVVAFRPLWKTKGFVGLHIDSRFGYRIAVGASSPLEGWAFDSILGLVVGF